MRELTDSDGIKILKLWECCSLSVLVYALIQLIIGG